MVTGIDVEMEGGVVIKGGASLTILRWTTVRTADAR
jgi:hypothetical protein